MDPNEYRTQQVVIRLPEWVIRQITKEAQRLSYKSRNELIAAITMEYALKSVTKKHG